MPIRVLLVDDHELVRQGVASMLAKAEDLTVVGEAKTGREAIETARKELPDVVLMDVRMPVMDGIEATKQLAGPGPAGLGASPSTTGRGVGVLAGSEQRADHVDLHAGQEWIAIAG